MLWTTDADKDMRNPTGNSLGQSPWIKTLGKGEIDYRGDPLVSSPIAPESRKRRMRRTTGW